MILVDYSSISIGAVHALHESLVKGTPEEATDLLRHVILNSLLSIKKKFAKEYGDIVIAVDNRRYWRKDYFPEYKASRKTDREASDLPWEAIYAAMDDVKDGLDRFFPYRVVDVEGAEADDVIGTLVHYIRDNVELDRMFDPGPLGMEEGPPLLIVSADKDFLQLQQFTFVKQYNPQRKQFVRVTPQEALEYLHEHIMRGDEGDGIPNVRMPNNTFVDHLRQLPITKTLIAQCKSDEGISEARVRLGFDRNRTLIDLDRAPMEVKHRIIDAFTNASTKSSRKLIYDYFVSRRLRNLMTSIEDF